MSGKRRRRGGMQSRHGREAADPIGGLRITTPEGDELVIATVRYRVDDALAAGVLLQAQDDFDLTRDPDYLDEWDPEGDEALDFVWLETRPGAPDLAPPLGRRVLASITLTGTTLEAEAMSQRRLNACHQRLEDLLSDGIRLLETRTRTMEQAMSESEPMDVEEPALPPAEYLAEIEEQMLRQWIDESIPALGGLTPREAAKTPEGREKVLALIEQASRTQGFVTESPGVFSPDYSKVKEMLDLD